MAEIPEDKEPGEPIDLSQDPPFNPHSGRASLGIPYSVLYRRKLPYPPTSNPAPKPLFKEEENKDPNA